jgi:hypothetical protein
MSPELDSLQLISSLNSFFFEQTKSLTRCQESTRAYISSVFANAKKEGYDYSNEALTLIYHRAHFEPRFELFQALGDWILYAKAMYPNSLKDCSSEYYDAIAQASYYRCYLILNRKWGLFEELADTFPYIVTSLQPILCPLAEKTVEQVEQEQFLLIRT